MNETKITAGHNDLGTLAKEARSLLTVTSDVAAEKLGEARQCMADGVESAKQTAGRVRDRAIDYAKATDEAVRQHPYQALGIALGIGAILGCLLSRRGPRSSD